MRARPARNPPQQQIPVVYAVNEKTIMIAFILILATLLIITIAMFKLAGSIATLSERLYKLEDLLEQCANTHCPLRY